MIINDKRALAYIVAIDEIKPIEGYDRVEYARTNGWWVVVSKNDNLKVGDKCVYFEVDSKVPEDDERFKFLESKHYKIKTQKMCKVYSQGLLMPISKFPEIEETEINTDVTDILKIKYSVAEDNVRKSNKINKNAKYNSMAARRPNLFKKQPFRWLMKRAWGRKLLFVFFGKKKDNPRSFPDFISKTDEERIENQPWRLGDGKKYIMTEKLDGCLDGNVNVVTDQGIFKISQIVNKKMNVNVLTYNESLEKCEYKPIADYHKWERVSDMYDIVVSQQGYKCGNRDKHIICTSEHSFYVGNGKYIKAKDLKDTDLIYHRYQTIDNLSKEILLGILLGDGSLSSKCGVFNGAVDFSHSVKQSDYIMETVRLLGGNQNNISKIISGYGSEMLRYHYCTNSEFKDLVLKICLKNNKKYVTKEWTDQLTPLSLAFWYMDDGCISNAESKNIRPTIMISTNAFTDEECENLMKSLKMKYNIDSSLRTRESYKGNVIYFNTDNTDKFCTLIAPYICPSMKYKLPEYLRPIKYCLSEYVSRHTGSIIQTKIISISKIEDYNKKYVYDLTVEGNHNYFANGVLTHNTSSTYALKKITSKNKFLQFFEKFRPVKYEFYVCSRNVRMQDENQECYHDHNIYWDMAFKYNIEQHLKDYLECRPGCDWVAVQGESVGSVQGNPLKLEKDDLYLFNLIDSQNGRYSSKEGKNIALMWGMKWVPILGETIIPDDMEEFKLTADGKSVVNPKVLREGIVYRSLDGKDSFKNVSRKFLLKKGE